MQIIKKILIIISKTLAVSGLIALIAVTATSISPVYRFHIPEPFAGPDIFNPYEGTDSSTCWKRANFHTHTRVDGPLNECDFTPEEVLESYDRLGYDIVTFSNHNKLTENPLGTEYQADAYEHGYNLLKFHKLVFGCSQVKGFDHLLPLTAFQKQFQFNMLGKDCDFIQFNHPLRTEGLSKRQMEKLEGYRIIELDSGRSTENEYWDWALSAGIYSFGLANDELGYVLPPNDFMLNDDTPYLDKAIDRFGRRHYEETNSMGPGTAEIIAENFRILMNKVNTEKSD